MVGFWQKFLKLSICIALAAFSSPFTLSASEKPNEIALTQNCDPQAEKNQEDIEDFLNAFMGNKTCEESNGLVICSVDSRPVMNLAAPESLGEEISLTSEQQSDLQSRLARLSEIFDLSVEEPLAITKDNKVYQIDTKNNIVTEIDLSTQQRKDVALDPNLLVAGFGGSGRLEILDETGQSDFIDFNELFNSGSEPAASNDPEPSNGMNLNDEPSSSYNTHLNDLGIIDPRTPSSSSMDEIETPRNDDENKNLMSQFAAIQQKLDLILEQLKKQNLNSMIFVNKNANPRETQSRPSLKSARFGRSSSFDFGNIANSNFRNIIDPASSVSGPNLTSPNDPNSSLVLGDSSIGDSSIAPSHLASNENFYPESGSSSDIASGLSNSADSEFDSQIENLVSEIFGNGIIENSRIASPSNSSESNPKDSRPIKPSLKKILNLTSFNKLSFNEPALDRMHEIMGFFESKNSSISSSVQKDAPPFKIVKSDHSSAGPKTSENTPQQAEQQPEPKLLATLNERRKLLTESETDS